MSEQDIKARLESLVDRWIKASPTERTLLIHEKIRLEEMLDRMATAKVG